MGSAATMRAAIWPAKVNRRGARAVARSAIAHRGRAHLDGVPRAEWSGALHRPWADLRRHACCLL